MKTTNKNKTLIIAEIGSNHCGSLELAKETILAAKECGADAVKFQSLNVYEQYIDPSLDIIELHKKIDFPEEWHYILKEFCDKNNIMFFSAPTYLRAVDILEEINVELYKLASAQIGTFPQIVEKVASLNKPTIISTGISSYAEIEKSVQIFKKYNNDKLTILHCNSIYPTPYDKVHLQRMLVYKQMFDCEVGFSDHTNGIYCAIAAVALGASVIEKHFVLNADIDTPDAAISIDPIGFDEMVKGIRAVEAANKVAPRIALEKEEASFKSKILYKLVAKNDIKAGSSMTLDKFEFKRSEKGIDCRDFDFFADKYIFKNDVPKNKIIELSDLEPK